MKKKTILWITIGFPIIVGIIGLCIWGVIELVKWLGNLAQANGVVIP